MFADLGDMVLNPITEKFADHVLHQIRSNKQKMKIYKALQELSHQRKFYKEDAMKVVKEIVDYLYLFRDF